MKRAVFACVALVGLSAAPVERDEAWVLKEARRVRESDNEAWRKVPWAATLTSAAKAAKAEGRPMFIFSHEGNIDTGRC